MYSYGCGLDTLFFSLEIQVWGEGGAGGRIVMWSGL